MSGWFEEWYKTHGAPIVEKVGNDTEQQELALKELCGVTGGGHGITLGGSSYIGGANDLQNYGNSVYSKAKEKLIREIAKNIFNALSATGLKNPDTMPLDKLVQTLAKLIPPRVRNPKKFAESFNKNAKKQAEVCNALGTSINRAYGSNIIDLDSDVGEMCNKIAEVMESLLTGLNTEFMTIAGDVLQTMKNMQTIMDFIDSAYKRQKELAQQSEDSTATSASAATDEIYTAIKSEYERQSAILANLINVSVGPTGKSLIGSLQDSGNFAGMVKDLKAKVGTTGFGDKLARLLAGVSTVAHSAELVEKSLKKIGMSVDEYRSVKNNNDLHMKVYKKIMSHSPTSKELDDMMKAAKIIYNCDYHAVSDFLKGKKKGAGDDNVYGGDVLDDDNENSDLPTYFAKKSLSKKIKDKKKYRELLLKDFRKMLKGIYRNIVDNASQISKHIGNEIPISDDVHYFVRAFSILEDLDREKLHIALSGYAKDSVSKEQRERYLNNYHLVIKAIDPLTKGPKSQLFKNLQQGLLNMVKAIDDFSDKLVKAVTEIHVDTPDEIANELSNSSKLFFGAGATDDELGSGSWVPFEKVKNEMSYYYNISNIRRNMSRVNDDLKTYADNYEQILGEEAGYLINKIQKHYNELINMDITKAMTSGSPNAIQVHTDLKNLYDANAATAVRQANLVNEKGQVGTGAGYKNPAEWAFKNLQDLWTYQMTAKVDLIKVAQAVDLYLKSFTDGITKNPDSVSHIVKLLDQVEIVARWFNEKSGDNLATLFEVFPNRVPDAPGGKSVIMNDPIDQEGKEQNIIGNRHYYEFLEEKWSIDVQQGGQPSQPIINSGESTHVGHCNMPGNPFIGRSLTPDTTTNKQLKSVFKLSQRVVKSMRALENILSCFANVGSKFGDLDPMAKTFMNPGQMFNILCQYISASSFTHQFAPNESKTGGLMIEGAVYKKEMITDAATAVGTNIPSNRDSKKYRVLYDNVNMNNNLFVNAYNSTIDAGTNAQVTTQTVNMDYYGIISGVSDVKVPDNTIKYRHLAMSSIPADSYNKWKYHEPYSDTIRLDMAGWKDDFYDTDLLFEMVLKSIVAKVFTVIDAYRLFNRPTVNRRSYYSLHPLRVILGGNETNTTGGDIENIKIIPDAIEFYYRLILLAEYYREKFGFTGAAEADDESWRLSMVPSIDGIWSDFIEVLFDKAEYVKEGNYTEQQVQKMIKSMNEIWKSYKSKNPSYNTINILNAFVLEMNKVFGFIKQKEINNYLNDRRQYLNETDNYDIKEDFIDYDLLDADSQFGSKPAPSDKFINTQIKNNRTQSRNMMFLQEKIENIRKSMDADFLNLTKNDQDLQYGFYDSLSNYKLEIKNSKSDADAYKVVLKMLQGANKYVNINGDKLIMLHESVVAPLFVLYGVYKVVAKYNALIHGCSLKNIEKWNEDITNKPPLANITEIRQSYRSLINKVYSKNNNKYTKELFMRSLLGYNVIQDDLIYDGYRGFVFCPNDTITSLRHADVDSEKIFCTLLNNIIELSTGQNKLVQCNVSSNGNINIDFSELEELCVTMINLIKNNINNLRSSFEPKYPNPILDKYENANIIGSVRWLEENLIEIIFKDRDECGINRGHSEHLKYTFDKLLNKNSTPLVSTNTISNDKSEYGTLVESLRTLVFGEKTRLTSLLSTSSRQCDFQTFPFNIIQPVREVSKTELKDLYELKFIAVNKLMPAPCIMFEPDKNDMLTNTYNFALNGQSLMFAFNRILQMYLYTNTDDNLLKIYAPLIENFATGAASLEVLQKKAYPNCLTMVKDGIEDDNTQHNISSLTDANADIGCTLGVPESPLSLVFASCAATIRSMLSTVTSLASQKKRFIYDSLLEIPEYMKDRMKTNLPIFSKMLNQLYERAAMLKMFLNNTNLKKVINGRYDYLDGKIADSITRTIAPQSGSIDLIRSTNMSTEESFSYYSSCLTKLMDLSNNLRKCADSVYKELQDKPSYFMETGKDFLNDYSNRFGGLPLMPASHLLIPFRCYEGNPLNWSSTHISHILMPIKENGSNVFKYNYATRLILSQNVEVGLEHLPGAKEIYNNYASITKNNLISTQQYSDTIKKMIKLSKFLIDGLVYNRLYNNFGGNRKHFNPAYNRYTGDNLKRFDRSFAPGAPHLLRLLNNLPAIDESGFAAEFQNSSLFNVLQMHDTSVLPGELYNIGHDGLAQFILYEKFIREAVESDKYKEAQNTLFNNIRNNIELQNIYDASNALKVFFSANMLIAAVNQKDPNVAMLMQAAADAAAAADLDNNLDYYQTLLKEIIDLNINDSNVMLKYDFDLTQQLALINYSAQVINIPPLDVFINNEFNAVDDSIVSNSVKFLNNSYIYRDDPTQFSNNDERIKNNMTTFQLSCVADLTDVIELTESNNLTSNKEKLANSLGTSTHSIKNENRHNMRLYNILDMNIVPINVHALMREIPFINLLNYSYTFDRLVHEFILPNYISDKLNNTVINTDNIMIKASDKISNTRELMVKLLTNPYSVLTGFEYFGKVSSLFNGDDNLRLGRPRYLSDQLWHKALITSSADNVSGQEFKGRFNNVGALEIGPAGYENARKQFAINYDDNADPTISDYHSSDGFNANRFPIATRGLKIYKDKNWRVVNMNNRNDNNMHPADVIYCAELGKLRFDTKLVRNLTWLVNLQRIMRVIMVTHLSQINTPVVRGLKIANPKITEFEGNDKFEEGDYDGTNYDLV
jgi:hypothetical protein